MSIFSKVLMFGLFALLIFVSIIGISLINIFLESHYFMNDEVSKQIAGFTEIGLMVFGILMIVYPTTLIYLLVQHFGIRIGDNSKQKDNNGKTQQLRSGGSTLNGIRKRE